MDLKDLERECLLAEKAHREEDDRGEPSFIMEVAKQTTQKDNRRLRKRPSDINTSRRPTPPLR